MYKNDRVTRRYSEPFKLKILSELSTGKYTKYELGKLYGIAPSTINEWIRRYERKDLMNTRVMIETKDEKYDRQRNGRGRFCTTSKAHCIGWYR
jgi:transposase-like protein